MARSVNPAARATRVRKWDDHRAPSFVCHLVRPANHRIEREGAEKPVDRQPSDWYDDGGADNA